MRLLTILLPCLLAAQSTVTPIEWTSLPAPVQSAAKKQEVPKGAKIKYVKLVRSGATFYEMKVDAADGRDLEILFRPDGAVAETEEAVPLSSIPAAVRAAIEKEARTGKLLKVDLLLRDGKTFYEGEILEQGTKKKPLFDPAGRRVN
ncbi:PepSY-like domain-containing protein [uncultured Paludibaculum sp.]|uniref:PepSY-like domain-containing protein n=1 Tax=uncultured Paludibaculum sp. TaxID=1765020 RepID=UPI002AAAD609|nr:PepSY-like domain-containing protein [uncultured Paludibaculum sp.]